MTKRTAEVLYKKDKWFRWVRQRQDQEEATREKESQKVKREAQMFRRHMKMVEQRMREQKKRDEARRQEAYLEQVHRERMSEAQHSEADEKSDLEWDPIEDVIEGERGSFVEMMKQLLWLEAEPDVPLDTTVDDEEACVTAGVERLVVVAPTTSTNGVPATSNKKENITPDKETPSKVLTRNAKKHLKARAKAKTKAPEAKTDEKNDPLATPKIEINEAREQMRQRLLTGFKPPEMHLIGGIDT